MCEWWWGGGRVVETHSLSCGILVGACKNQQSWNMISMFQLPPSINISLNVFPIKYFFVVVGLPPKAESMEGWPRWGVITPFLYLLQCYDEFKWGRHWGTFVFYKFIALWRGTSIILKKWRLFTWSFLRWVFSNQILSIYLIHISKLKPIIFCLAGNCFSYLFQFQNLVSVASWMVHIGRNEHQVFVIFLPKIVGALNLS